jgi:hypothetical protein
MRPSGEMPAAVTGLEEATGAMVSDTTGEEKIYVCPTDGVKSKRPIGLPFPAVLFDV